VTPITSSDTAVAELKTVHLSFAEQIDLLTSQCETFTAKAREATSKKNRILALSVLKSRKLSESALQKRSDALVRIEEVLNGVEQAASDAEIVRTLEGGAKALERLNKDIGGIERVEEIMDRVREGVQESEDVGKIIAELGSGKVDESEIQEELDDMLKAELEREQREREQRELLKKEPDKIVERKEEQVKEERLVSELKNVTLQGPEVNERKELQEAIPS
jgi:charged multivesicular body protein 7